MRRDRLALSAEDRAALPQAHRQQAVTRYSHQDHPGIQRSVQECDAVAEEVAVALSYNGIAHAVMMATPQDLEDFAVGFSLSEGIVDSAAQIHDLHVLVNEDGLELQISIAAEHFNQLKQKRRTLVGRTGCGLCGAESLAMLDFSTPPIPDNDQTRITPQVLRTAFAALQSQQIINGQTGSVHAAAWANRNGEILCVREDLGRHNALDKLIGALARSQQPRPPGFLLLTSRASYELVQKAARAGMPFVAAISAPTSLAIRIAEQAGMTLIGFARNDGFVVYNGSERLHQSGLL